MKPPIKILRWLEKDYDDARNAIDKFDGQLFTIRNWAVTSAGALLALGFSTSERIVPLVGILPIAVFAYLEMTYKCFHEDAMRRSREMERLIRNALSGNDVASEYRFGLGEAFTSPTLRRVWETLRRRPHIARFYVGLLIALVTAAILIPAEDLRSAVPPTETAPVAPDRSRK